MIFSPFVKQLFVGSAPLLASLSVGGAVSYPTVLLHQLKRNDTTIPLDFDTASWIGAIHGLAGIPSILVPAFMQWRGRKVALIVACLVSILGWVLAYSANSAWVLLASESIHGFGSNSMFAIAYLSISEMIAPAYRDSFMQMFLILELMVMAVNGLLTHYLHWKTISIIMCVPMVLALMIACMWPESPYWLAYKGEFEKCQKAFVWLRGTDAISDNELRELIEAQKENIAGYKHKTKKNFMYYWSKISKRDFYVPAIHIFILEYLVYGMGSIAMLIYSIEIFQKATNNENIAFYGGFVANGIELLAVAAAIIVTRYLNKKTILITATFCAVVSLICASAVSYLESGGFLAKESFISVYFLIAYFISIGIGVVSIAYCIAAEVMPVKHRGIFGILYVSNTCVFHTLTLKLAPYLLLYIDLHGTFLVFALNGLVCGLLIWKFVPDTHGKTLQEIEDYYIRRIDRNSACKSENHIERMLQSGE